MTYSIVARDPSTGELGVAVQSHWFSVGTVVSWAEAGVGAVATQSFAEPAYGPNLLGLLRRGMSASSALSALTSVDDERARRQAAVVDTDGDVGVHTGDGCIAHSGHAVGEGVSCQANMMAGDTVPRSMLDAYVDAAGEPLAERLVTALAAGQGAGGDVRGRQSSALLVVAATGTGRPWVDRLVDLRVEDHREPVGELERLLALHRGYGHMNAGDGHLTVGDAAAASAEYEAARGFGITEAGFWHGVMLAGEGELERASELLAAAFAEGAGWRELLTRLPDAGLASEEVVRDLLGRIPETPPRG